MGKDQLSRNMKLEIIKLSEKILGHNLSEEEMQHVMKDRSLIGLESVLDYLKNNKFTVSELEQYLKTL